jgi:hypothetical protein
LAAARDAKLTQIGESARLVEKVLERDRQLAELQATLGGLRETAAAGLARPVAPAVTRGPRDGTSGLAARVSEALLASGVVDVQVAEADGPRAGALFDLLLLVPDPLGGQRALQAPRAELASDGRGLQLLCPDARVAGAVAPGAYAIDLPDPDLPAWEALGLPLPQGYLQRASVAAALTLVVGPHGWSVSSLQGWDGSTLLGLELSRPEPGGGERIVRAARASLSPVGPELVLEQGSIRTRGDERPFFGGTYRIALPGADYGSWLASVGPPGP